MNLELFVQFFYDVLHIKHATTYLPKSAWCCFKTFFYDSIYLNLFHVGDFSHFLKVIVAVFTSSRPLTKPLPCWTPSTVTPTKTAPWSCSCSVTIWQWVFYLCLPACQLLSYTLTFFALLHFRSLWDSQYVFDLTEAPFRNAPHSRKYVMPNKAILLGRTCNISVKHPSWHTSELTIVINAAAKD